MYVLIVTHSCLLAARDRSRREPSRLLDARPSGPNRDTTKAGEGSPMLALLGRRLASAAAPAAAATAAPAAACCRGHASSRAAGDLRDFVDPEVGPNERVTYGEGRARSSSRFFPGRGCSAGLRRRALPPTARPDDCATRGTGPAPPTAQTIGRPWFAHELRLKSWDDLHKLWWAVRRCIPGGCVSGGFGPAPPPPQLRPLCLQHALHPLLDACVVPSRRVHAVGPRRYVCLKERNLVATHLNWHKGKQSGEHYKERYQKVQQGGRCGGAWSGVAGPVCAQRGVETNAPRARSSRCTQRRSSRR